MSSDSISIPVSPEMRAMLTAQKLESDLASLNRGYAALQKAFKRGDPTAVKKCLDWLQADLANVTDAVRHLDLVLFVAAPPVEAPDA